MNKYLGGFLALLAIFLTSPRMILESHGMSLMGAWAFLIWILATTVVELLRHNQPRNPEIPSIKTRND